MIDNKKVNSSRQAGIERVKLRKGDMEKGQGGKMSQTPRQPAEFKRSGKAETPRRA